VNAEETICQAIRSHTPLALTYEGDRDGVRAVHPQVLYLDAGGMLLVDCWQLSGPSRSGGPLPAWRAFELAKIEQVEPSDGEIEAAPGLNLQAPKYSTVLAHV
jgi:predicted DNA-binding transcriptional regulator YafY